METTIEQKPLTKHISAAVNAIQKEIDKRDNKLRKLLAKSFEAQKEADALRESISGLEEQIKKLKGEL